MIINVDNSNTPEPIDVINRDRPPLSNEGTDIYNDPEQSQSQLKINVKTKDSLFLLSYSNIPSQKNTGSNLKDKSINKNINEFTAHLFIDIPVVDYYNYRMDSTRDSNNGKNINKVVKKIKINKLRDMILNAVTNDNDAVWDLIKESTKTEEVKVDININSSGSLIYVETIKYVMESIYNKLLTTRRNENLKLLFHVEVSAISLKWFNQFIDNNLLLSKIKFITKNSGIPLHKTYKNPFKDYYTLLNDRFINYNRINKGSNNAQQFLKKDSIIVVTNNTGVKALLTILSDRPLIKLISQESLALLDDFEKKNANEPNHNSDDNDNEDNDNDKHELENDQNPSVKFNRQLSSIMSIQNSMLTSNKDKSVRIRSLSINRDQFDKNQSLNNMLSTSKEVNISDLYNVDDTTDSDSNDSSSSSDDDSGDVLSIDIPTKLSRTNSDINLQNHLRPKTKNRFRSLSLMEQNYGLTNRNSKDIIKNNSIMRNKTFTNIRHSIPHRSITPLMEPIKLTRSTETNDSSYAATELTDEEEMDLDDVYQINGKSKSNSEAFPIKNETSLSTIEHRNNNVNNIHVHDGDFEDILLYPPSISKKKKRRNTLTNGNYYGSTNMNTGLIPPEFYSRISTPSSSTNSSNLSISNMAYVVPQKVGLSDLSNGSNERLFEKNLIKKSFEEIRKQNSISSLFETLIGGYNESESNSNYNPLALNFKSKAKRANNFPNLLAPSPLKVKIMEMDEEDMMMSGTNDKEPEASDMTDLESDSYASIDNRTLNNEHEKEPDAPSLASNVSSYNLAFGKPDSVLLSSVGNSFSSEIPKNTGFNFGLSLYDESDSPDDDKTITQDTANRSLQSGHVEQSNKTAYKKAFTIDLYGESDSNNSDAWFLGGNK